MRYNPSFLFLSSIVASSILLAPALQAANGTWTVDANGLWSTSSNWVSGTIADGSGFTANFTNNITADRTVSLDGNRTLTNLVFGDSDTATAGSWILNNNGTSTNTLTLAGTTPGITVNALGTGKNATISAIIAGSAGLVKSGTGTLTLTGANTYTGTATINAGTVKVTGAGKLGGDSVSVTLADVAGATLDFTGIASSRTHGNLSGGGANGGNIVLGGSTMYFGNNASNTTYGGIISGTGSFNYAGTGTQTLTGNNTFDGKIGVSRGVLSISSISSVGGGASSVGSATTAANGRIDIGDRTTTGTLLYTGSGHTTDRSVNLAGYTGGATLDASGSGALVFSSNFTAIGVGSKTLTLTGNNTADNRIGGAIVNNTTTGATVTTAASSSSTALVLASVDGLTVGNAISGTGITGGTTISAIDTATKTVTLSAAATVANAAAITSAGLVNTTSLTKAGTGKWILSGNNTYTGATTISAGTLQIGANGTSGTLSTSSAITNNGTLVFSRNNTITQGTDFASVIAGTGNVIKEGSGTLVLSGANTYAGATTISAGTLTVSGGSAIANTGAVSVSSGAVFNLSASETIGSIAGAGSVTLGANTLTTGSDNSSTTLSGVLSGASGALTKSGTGTLALTGNNTYTGSTTVNAGTLQAAATGALGSTSQVVLNEGGSFLVTADNAVNDSAAINLNGGRMALSGNFDETVGLLTLSANSTLDFSGFAGTLRFGGIGSWATGATLAIWNWSGTTQHETQINNYANPSNLVFTNNSNLNSNLANISFYSDSGNSFVGNGFGRDFMGPGGGTEIIAVPEPEAFFYAVVLLAGVAVQYLRRRAKRKALQGHRPA
jgi:autotransporter-associated beta strand protein